jgi:hypothetical protein
MRTKYLIFLLPFIFFACKKTINPKKEAFYCKINGKDFIPEVDKSPIGGVGSSPLEVEWDRQNGWFYISALNRPQYISIKIKLPPNISISTGEYIFSDIPNITKATYSYNSTAELKDKEFLNSSSGKVIITKIVGGTIWGTFEFKTKSIKTNQEYTITEGQFNELRYF